MQKVIDFLMPFVIVGLGAIITYQQNQRDTTIKELQATHTYKQVDSLQTELANLKLKSTNDEIELGRYRLARETFGEYNPLGAYEYENILRSLE
jgi:hypothetical protein